MKYCGLYFISNPSNNLDAALTSVNNLVQGIENNIQAAKRQAPWSLQYRLFRDTIPPGHKPATDTEGKSKPFAHTLQHLLHLSSLDQTRTYTCTQPPTGKSYVSSLPLRQQEAHALLVRNQLASLWQPRSVLHLSQGASYTTGLCTVQLGELRSNREGMQSGGIQSPGVLVCISTVIGAEGSDDGSDDGSDEIGENEVDFEYAQAVVRDCWSRIKENRDLGKSEVREVMMAQENVTGAKEKETAVRMWCEVLRLRA
ncbi:hypothetical protein GQ44DRAFT_286460 [Phaeosphaeriaceae sp. PMI808]|nr:hypothetical protein GQ44DRAFT_286460 [Phaeosphaeriaceae sp. PMI808]